MEEPWLLSIDPVRALFFRIEESLVVHSAFAFMMASSASLSLTSILFSRSPDPDLQRIAPAYASYGAFALLAGVALGLFAFGLLVSSFLLLAKMKEAGWSDSRPSYRFLRIALTLGVVLVVVWAPIAYLTLRQSRLPVLTIPAF